MATRVADKRRGRRLLGSLAAQLGFDFGESEPINPAVAPTPRQPRSEDKSAISGSAEPISQVIGLPSWQHPLANHQIKLPTAYIGYHLKRGKRRTIGMSVGMEGLVVQAPRWVGIAEIESVLREKGFGCWPNCLKCRRGKTSRSNNASSGAMVRSFQSLIARFKWF